MNFFILHVGARFLNNTDCVRPEQKLLYTCTCTIILVGETWDKQKQKHKTSTMTAHKRKHKEYFLSMLQMMLILHVYTTISKFPNAHNHTSRQVSHAHASYRLSFPQMSDLQYYRYYSVLTELALSSNNSVETFSLSCSDPVPHRWTNRMLTTPMLHVPVVPKACAAAHFSL